MVYPADREHRSAASPLPFSTLPVDGLNPMGTLALAAGLGLAGLIASLAVFLAARASLRRQVAEVREEAEAVLADARRRAETEAQEALLEAREAAARTIAQSEQETLRRLSEASESEGRAELREAAVARRESEVEQALEEARKVGAEAEAAEARARQEAAAAEQVLKEQIRKLEEIAGLTSEQARSTLMERIEKECRQEVAHLVSKLQAEARHEANETARRIVLSALSRISGREVLDPVVTMVRLPGDEMKGRVIGREGRNIRTLELATGVDVIIDNTPGVILLSAYDPMRREIARVALERLIEDGRIHPARIETVVERTREEIEGMVQEAGETAAFELGITDIHVKLQKLLGKLRFRTLRGYNLLLHSTETALLAGYMAAELGAREQIAQRAGLLHAISWAEDEPRGGPGAAASAEIAGKFGEAPEVVHAISALAPGVEARTAEAVLVQVARRISEARPGARKDNLASFIERMRRLEEIASSFPGVRHSYAVKGGKELRILVESSDLSDEDAVLLSRELARRIEREVSYNAEIKVSVIRETRAVDYAV